MNTRVVRHQLAACPREGQAKAISGQIAGWLHIALARRSATQARISRLSSRREGGADLINVAKAEQC